MKNTCFLTILVVWHYAILCFLSLQMPVTSPKTPAKGNRGGGRNSGQARGGGRNSQAGRNPMVTGQSVGSSQSKMPSPAQSSSSEVTTDNNEK